MDRQLDAFADEVRVTKPIKTARKTPVFSMAAPNSAARRTPIPQRDFPQYRTMPIPAIGCGEDVGVFHRRVARGQRRRDCSSFRAELVHGGKALD